jgi:glycosyltransferase involved in cell wall biosynthesis
LALLRGGPLVSNAEAEGVTVWELPFEWKGNKLHSLGLVARRVWDFACLLRKTAASLLISYTFNDLIMAGIAARLTGIPIVYRAQGELFVSGSDVTRTWLGSCLVPTLKILRPLIICTTKTQAANMLCAGLSEAMVRQVYLGVSQGDPPFDESIGPSQTRKSDGAPIMSMFGRLVEWKGQDIFLKALVLLHRRGINFEAWIVGSSEFGGGSDYERHLHEITNNGGIMEKVKFLGFRSDVPRLMAASDIVCHASMFEPFGLVVAEAMMAGRPVVASDVSGPQESVINGVTGILVTPGSFEVLANALEQLLGDSQRREIMGRNARKRALELFDQTSNFRSMDILCDALMK